MNFTKLSLMALSALIATTVSAANFKQDAGTQGLVSLEVENAHDYAAVGGSSWKYLYDAAPGYSDDEAGRADPDNGTAHSTNFVGNSPWFEFRVEFAHTGTHYVWVRGLAPSTDSNEIHVGLNGAADPNADNIDIPTPLNQANWSDGSHTINVPSTGNHAVRVWMGEDGVIVDKIVLTTDSGYTPTGEGPAESALIGPVAKWSRAFVDPETTGNSIDVLANDYHTESESFWITTAQQNGTYGTLSVNGAGDALIYDAPTPHSGQDEVVNFSYTVTDAAGRLGDATGVIVVSDNDFPVAANDSFGVAENSSNNSLSVMMNDTDPNSDPLEISFVWGTNQGGSVSINGTKDAVLYTPATGFVGTETFTYKIKDGRPFSVDTAQVTVTVSASGSNQPPVANDDAYMVDQDTSNNSLAVLANDTDPDGDTLSLSSLGTTSNGGSVSISGTNVLYTPAAGYVGNETFTYTMTDGTTGHEQTATVTMTVNSTNTPPVAVNDSYNVTQGTSNNSLSVLGNDTDADLDTLNIDSVGAPSNGGTATINGTNVDYTPDPGFTGVETFTYTASDGNGGSDSATVSVTVDPVVTNQPPVLATIGNQSAVEGFQLSLSITATDSDGPAPLVLSQTNNLPGNPNILTDNGDGTGTLSWTPATGDAANSPYSVTVTATDGDSAIDSEVITVTVNEPAVATYTYNAMGQRVSKTIGSEIIHFVYDQGGQLIAEIDASTGQTVREYVYANGEQTAVIDDTDTLNEEMYFVHNDHLGTPQSLSDESEQVVWSADYEPFGRVSTLTNTIDQQIRFPGQYEDAESGLYYNYFRTYDPSTGRYTQSDPIGLYGGLNSFAYVGNNPLVSKDPFGLAAQACLLPWVTPACAEAAAVVVMACQAIVVAGVSIMMTGDECGGDSCSTDGDPEFEDTPENQPPFTGVPGSTVRGGTGSRTYGDDGYPETDRDTGHPDEAGVGSGDHAHDWSRPDSGGPPTHDDRGPGRLPRPGDPPLPRGPNVPPPSG